MEPSNTVAEPPAPVMDVRPPTEESAPNTHTPEPQPAEQHKEPPAPPKPPKQKAPPKPKQPGNGVTAAIMATVIIVLGLAALATYAYIKTR